MRSLKENMVLIVTMGLTDLPDPKNKGQKFVIPARIGLS